ncbi:MAG: type I glyceraldehyde-3-phosphate dehydrogenase [Nannocystaceae bacterium]|nr:type I glyceraldehyde-3-phosphate dehydrogenase [Nannocystaceae bacterium]
MAIKIGINGFGRIGRLFYRIAAERGDIEVVGVNDLVPAPNLSYLLRYDSTHGRFSKAVTDTDEGWEVEGVKTRCISERDPAKLPWGEMGVDYVLESTGVFTAYDGAMKHVQAGARRVLISAPTKTPEQVPTIAYKVNHETYNPETHKVVSNASCTTNCLAPISKVIEDNFGLAEGLMTTVHSVTATQPTQDGPSQKDLRGGRNGYTNIIPASTGAAKAVALCIPELAGKLTGMAFRVPTADVSVVDLTFRTSKSTSLTEINAAMKAASEGSMEGVLGYTEEPVVSSDFISDPRSSIYDAKAAIALNEHFFKIVSWYDNEYGYASRCIDMISMIARKDGL